MQGLDHLEDAHIEIKKFQQRDLIKILISFFNGFLDRLTPFRNQLKHVVGQHTKPVASFFTLLRKMLTESLLTVLIFLPFYYRNFVTYWNDTPNNLITLCSGPLGMPLPC